VAIGHGVGLYHGKCSVAHIIVFKIRSKSKVLSQTILEFAAPRLYGLAKWREGVLAGFAACTICFNQPSHFPPNLRGMKFGAVALLLLAIVVTLVVADWMAKKRWLPLPIARKMLHIVGVGSCALALALFTNLLWLRLLIGGFVLLLLAAVRYNWIGLNKGTRKSWGIALFPVAYLLLLLAFAPGQPWLVVYPMLILTFSDAGAAIVGETFAMRFFHVTADRKSWLGSASFAVISFLILGVLPLFTISYLHLPFAAAYRIESWLCLAACMAVVLAVAEASCSSGWDNFVVPLLAAWLLHMALQPNGQALVRLPVGMLLALAVALLAHQRQWLNLGGAVVAALLGAVVWTAGGFVLAAPLVSFFVMGSLLSKLPAGRHLAADAKHQKPRDWQQVLCNGGVAGLCAMAYGLTGAPQYLIAVFASMAVCMADTCASEIGMRYGGKPMDLLRLKQLPTGVSGGVSWAGSLAGLCGALGMAGLGTLWTPAMRGETLVWVAAAGFAGMLLDSVLGSAFQARYNLQGQASDVPPPGEDNTPQKGWAWLTNDLVNLLSNLLITAAVLYMGWP
jgi:uncharacterized protein (TIGR00297 family)